MAWIKLDDHFDEHPKFAKVGPLGMALWITGLAYCNRNLTDGFIPWTVARNMVSWEFAGPPEDDGRQKVWTVSMTCGMAGEDVTCKAIIPMLLDAGLWDEVEGGYYVHDYPDYQPLKAQIEAERQKKIEAGRAGGQASAQARGQAGASAKPKQTASTEPSKPQAKSNPDPVPVPDPLVGDKSPTPPAAPAKSSGYPADFESWWAAYPPGHGVKKAAYEHWKKIKPDAAMVQVLIEAVDGWQQSDRWKRGFVMDAQRWLRDRAWESVPPPQTPNGALRVHQGGKANGEAATPDEWAEWRRKRGIDQPPRYSTDEPDDVIDVKASVR